MAPLNTGEPLSTGLVGLAPSCVMKAFGELGSSARGPVGLPITQPVGAPPQTTPPIDWPWKKPSNVTVGAPAPPP